MKRLILDFESEYDLRRLLETIEEEDGQKVLKSLGNGKNMGIKAIVVKEEYLIANLEDKLKKIRDGIAALKKSGFGMELLEKYLRAKGISKRTFDLVMDGMQEFFYQLE